MTLTNAINKAQKSADRWQMPFAVLDINPFYAPVFIVRIWDDIYTNNPDLIQKVIPQLGG